MWGTTKPWRYHRHLGYVVSREGVGMKMTKGVLMVVLLTSPVLTSLNYVSVGELKKYNRKYGDFVTIGYGFPT